MVLVPAIVLVMAAPVQAGVVHRVSLRPPSVLLSVWAITGSPSAPMASAVLFPVESDDAATLVMVAAPVQAGLAHRPTFTVLAVLSR
jgi:hypothetical protein